MVDKRESTALIFCPYLSGHRQNYVFVFTKWFLQNNYHVILALGSGLDGVSGATLPVISGFKGNEGITFIDLGKKVPPYSDFGEHVNIVLDLERRFNVSLTLFPIGDELRKSLYGLGFTTGSTTLRRVAIWIHLTHIYGWDLSNDPILSRFRKRLSEWKSYVTEKYYFQFLIWKWLGLDMVINTNPDFMKWTFSSRYHYMPEIYKPWGIETYGKKIIKDDFQKRASTFLNKHHGKKIIFYYGNWADRRGFDDLLMLTIENPDTVFISCGRPGIGTNYKRDVTALMKQLKNQDRLLDLRLPFLPSHPVVDDIFNATKFILLPYRDFYGMSGSMIEAASYGKPVLVPDIGYMAARVREYGIGLCYRHKNYDDFKKNYKMMCQTYESYVDSAKLFSAQFSATHIHESITAALTSIQ